MPEPKPDDTKPQDDKDSRREKAPRPVDLASGLSGMPREMWDALSDEECQQLIGNIDTPYKEYLGTFYRSANQCVTRYNDCNVMNIRWRRTAIVGSGIVACLNFLAANKTIATETHGALLPIAAAIAALVLAVLANLETLSNAAEKAQAFRESRELFLDAAQEFDRIWTVHVVALGTSVQAYENASVLYQRIIAADAELRRKFKELSSRR
jgi:hypothetical protein